jgi:hypothetical protein
MIRNVAMILAWSLTSQAQVHLITGSPVPSSSQGFAAALHEVRDDGSVRLVAEIVAPCPNPKMPCDSKQGGVGWIAVSYDAGIAIFVGGKISVVDLQKASIVKTCPPPAGPPNSSWLNQWLLDTPSYGPVLALAFSGAHPASLVGLRTTASLPCERSAVSMEPVDLRYVSALGTSGIADIGVREGINIGVGIDDRGSLVNRFGGGLVPYGYDVPASLREGLPSPPYTSIIANDSEIMLLFLSDREGWNRRILAFRKRDRTWHAIPLPAQVRPASAPAGTHAPSMPVRAFGHFVTLVEAHLRDAQNTESAGASEWRDGSTRSGPDVAYMFQNYSDVFPGRLHIYDVETRLEYVIDTKQGDSEVLLVDSGTVNYRASDRLYSVPITENGLGSARLLATDYTIRDAHWAFIKR